MSNVEHILQNSFELEAMDEKMKELGYERILLSNAGLEKGARATYRKLIKDTVQ